MIWSAVPILMAVDVERGRDDAQRYTAGALRYPPSDAALLHSGPWFYCFPFLYHTSYCSVERLDSYCTKN